MVLSITRFLAVASVVLISCGAWPQTAEDEVDIYPYVIEALQELKIRRELAEEVGIHAAPASGSVCYEDLGCFDRGGTFKHLKQLPDTPENVATTFLLYTASNPHKAQILDYTKPETVLNSHLDYRFPLKFITHGFGGKNNISWIMNMKNEFLKKENMNVIVVDWSKGAAIPHYINAVVNTELVGAQVAALFLIMKDQMGFSEKHLHVIGFSLGAHVSGFIGKRLKELRGIRPARVTGLDPASPLFEEYGEDVHLYKDDGDFVDIIHTNADILVYGGVGMEAAIGHVDYYPNGGVRQPGCPSTITGLFKDIMMEGLKHRVCNHQRAVSLFTESIRNEKCFFNSHPCENFKKFSNAECFSCSGDSCGVMGYKNKGLGVQYFLTKATAPYCAENVKVTVKYSQNNKKSHGKITVIFIGNNGEKDNVTLTKKDEKLKAGASAMVLGVIGPDVKSVKGLQILYNKYNGWISKGTPTFTISSVSIQDHNEEILFNACSEEELEDDVIHTMQPTEKSC